MKQKSEIRSQKSEIRTQSTAPPTHPSPSRGEGKGGGENLSSGLWILCSVFMLTVLMFASGCATTGEIQKVGAVTAINIIDDKLNIAVDKPFTYTIYKSSDPYKVIVEIPDVRLGIAPNKIKLDKAGITEVTPSQTEEPLSTRLEILLSSPVSVEPIYKDTALAIRVKEEPEATVAEEVVTAVPKAEEKVQKVQEVKAPGGKIEEPVKEVKWPAEPQEIAKPEEKPVIPTEVVKEEAAAPKPELKVAVPKEFPPATSIVGVNIAKEENFLKVIIKGNGSLSPDVFRLDNRAVLDMPNVEMAASLPAAVPLPLKSIRAGKHKDKTRLVFDMKEKTSFDVAAVEDSVIVSFRIPEKEKYVAKAEKAVEVEAKAVVLAPEKPVEGKYKGQKISLDFQDAEIGPIFRLLADISGYNFVIDPAVKGKITMKLMNVPWDQSLDIILQTFSLGKSIEGNIIWIAPTSMFAKMADEKTKTKEVEEKAEELMQEVIRINYATASELNTAITQGKLLSTRGSITTDSRMNTLIIKDTQTSINKIKELVKIMDVAKPQVMIEAKIVTVSSNYSETLGIRWGGTFIGSDIKGVGGEVSGNFSVNTPVVTAGASTTNPGGVLGMTIGSASSLQVQLSLSALETIKKAKTLSNPKILTLDNEQATIQQGRSFFVQTVSAEGTKSEEKNATLSLSVKPKITPDGYIQLDITASDDTLESVSPPVINKKSIQTKALVKHGETLVLGGIYTTSTVEEDSGVPLLSKIPVLGWLFKTKTQTGPDVKELLIFITPAIVSQP